MPLLKKIDRLVASSFIGPYLLSFFVAEFVLIMMFLWKYIDEILGKGFTMFDILELIFYYGVTIIPLAVPITILISSVMVFGDMSERHELSSMKSAGVSLIRIMKPAIYIAVWTAVFSIFASNFLKPKANYLFMKRFTALRKQKPALTIEEGIFNKDFKGYAIKVASKEKDDQTINDVIIYDHTDADKSKISMIKSKSGKMYTSDEGNYFVMNLYDGNQYRELTSTQRKTEKKSKYPFMRTKFDTWQKVFDMSEFEADASGVNINRNKEDMLTTTQLLVAIDSVRIENDKLRQDLIQDYNDLLEIYSVEAREAAKEEEQNENTALVSSKDTVIDKSNLKKITKVSLQQPKNTSVRPIKNGSKSSSIFLSERPDTIRSILDLISPSKRKELSKQAASYASSRKDNLTSTYNQIRQYESKEAKYKLKLHQTYSWALVCIIFLFIGAPLGSIIRKGGYGYPLLVAILFYMIFMIMTIVGGKLNRNQSMDPVLAAWLPCLVLSPVAIWLTIKALKDSKFNPMSTFSFVKRAIDS